jgi:hypothetical protein
VTVRIPELRAIGRRRSLGVLAATLLVAGCAAPAARESQAPAATASMSATATPPPPPGPTATAPPNLAEPGDTVTLAEPGDTVTLAAVDRTGRYGTITVIRGGVRPVRPDERERADADEATTVLDVHIAYLPVRASDIGFGASDWGYGLESDNPSVVTAAILYLPILRGTDRLGTALQSSSVALSGTIAIPVPRLADVTIALLYDPIEAPVDSTRVRLPTQ